MEGQIDVTQFACLEKAWQVFPKLKVFQDAEEPTKGDGTAAEPKFDFDQRSFRLVSTGKFIWDVPLPAPVTGRLICTGDFNARRIETLNYQGLEKRPAANEVWTVPNNGGGFAEAQNIDEAANAAESENMENAK